MVLGVAILPVDCPHQATQRAENGHLERAGPLLDLAELTAATLLGGVHSRVAVGDQLLPGMRVMWERRDTNRDPDRELEGADQDV